MKESKITETRILVTGASGRNGKKTESNGLLSVIRGLITTGIRVRHCSFEGDLGPQVRAV